jgi:hypothetical protein
LHIVALTLTLTLTLKSIDIILFKTRPLPALYSKSLTYYWLSEHVETIVDAHRREEIVGLQASLEKNG